MKRISVLCLALLFCLSIAAAGFAKDLIDVSVVKPGMSKDEVNEVISDKYGAGVGSSASATIIYNHKTDHGDVRMYYMSERKAEASNVRILGTVFDMDIHSASLTFIEGKLAQIAISYSDDPKPLLDQISAKYKGTTAKVQSEGGTDTMMFSGQGNGLDVLLYYYVAHDGSQAPNSWLVYSVPGFEQALRARMK